MTRNSPHRRIAGFANAAALALAIGFILQNVALADPPAADPKATAAQGPQNPGAQQGGTETKQMKREEWTKNLPPAIQHQAQTQGQPAATVQLKEGQKPQIEFDTPIYDFGRIKSGDPIDHEFWFHNSGTGPLEITQVRPACGCTTMGTYDRIVEPGKSGKLPIRVTTGKSTGPMAKTITISTNVAGPNSQVILQVKGELWLPIQATPNMASFGNVNSGQLGGTALERKLTIVNNLDEKADIKDIQSTAPDFKTEIKVLEPGKKFELTVKLGSVNGAGVKAGSITMNTGLKEMPSLQIPVNAYIVADVDVIPKSVALPNGRTAPIQRELYVRNNAKTPLKITDLAASNPDIKLTLSESQPGMAFSIKMDIPEKYTPTNGDKISFKTSAPGFGEMTVPVVLSNYTPPNPAGMSPASVTPASAQKPVMPAARPAGPGGH